MSPRLDHVLPLLWRSSTSLQLGLHRSRAVLDDAGGFEQGMLSALRAGASRETLHTMSPGLDGTPERVDALLELLSPAFEPAHASSGRLRIIVDGDDPIAHRIATDLTALGHDVVHAGTSEPDSLAATTSVDLAILVSPWVIAPARYLPWLRRDIRHLSVRIDDEGAEIGPLVVPGDSSCLRCLDLTRRDADPAWPVIAAQLANRPPPHAPGRHTALGIGASAVVTRAIDALQQCAASEHLIVHPLHNATMRISARDSTPRRDAVAEHPRCGCRTLAEIATVAAHHAEVRSPLPSSVRAARVPA